MSTVHSFPPLTAPHVHLLILGSMPGRASLRANQYYAHPRNAFWPIVERLFHLEPGLGYEERCALLVQQGVAVWDVLMSCTRESSLDSDIDTSSIVANDFAEFFAAHPAIGRICFNGAMAQQVFDRHVAPRLPSKVADLPRLRLPSTSPANAAYSFERKLECWRVIRDIR